MLKIYRYSSTIAGVITVAALLASLFFMSSDDAIMIWTQNVCIGLFASGFLMVFSSVIGYVCEEKRVLNEYYEKLSELKKCAVEVSTIPRSQGGVDSYFSAIKSMDQLLSHYFAILDISFLLNRRKKIQVLFEIHTKLAPLKRHTTTAFLKIREYMCGTLDDNGCRHYTFEAFKSDIQDYIDDIDNFEDSGNRLAIWIEKKEAEYYNTVFKKK